MTAETRRPSAFSPWLTCDSSPAAEISAWPQCSSESASVCGAETCPETRDLPAGSRPHQPTAELCRAHRGGLRQYRSSAARPDTAQRRAAVRGAMRPSPAATAARLHRGRRYSERRMSRVGTQMPSPAVPFFRRSASASSGEPLRALFFRQSHSATAFIAGRTLELNAAGDGAASRSTRRQMQRMMIPRSRVRIRCALERATANAPCRTASGDGVSRDCTR